MVPSGTTPLIRAFAPAMFATIEVIGATVDTIVRPASASEGAAGDVQAVRARVSMAASRAIRGEVRSTT